jgi:hypothetical protein
MRTLPIAWALVAAAVSAQPASAADATLPSQRAFRTRTASFNRRYLAVVKDGGILVKPNPASGQDGNWVPMSLPDGLKGDAREISIDDIRLVAIDSKHRIYTHQQMMSDLPQVTSVKSWTKKWGAPFWLGFGHSLPQGALAWDLSVVSPQEDEFYFDTAGHRQRIGRSMCTTVYVLNGDGRHITILDPWLPTDYSYELDGPHRGRFVASSLSASGSTVFVINKHGDMYTRLWDFDIAGEDTTFFKYSYDDQRGIKAPAKIPNYLEAWLTYPAVQLPIRPWQAQPKIKGRITDQISISKHDKGCVQRTLRVAGLDAAGHPGYFEKDIAAQRSEDWVFHQDPEGRPLSRPLIDNREGDTSAQTMGAPEESRFRYAAKGFTADLSEFNVYSSPARIQVTLGGRTLELQLHFTDGLRQLGKRNRGLDSNPRSMHAVIEVPEALFQEALGAKTGPLYAFLKGHISVKNRFVRVSLSAAANQVVLKRGIFFGESWTFRAQP